MHKVILLSGIALLVGCSNKHADSDPMPKSQPPKPAAAMVPPPSKMASGMSQGDRARIAVYEYSVSIGCEAAASGAQLLRMGGKSSRRGKPLTWDNVRDGLASSNASNARTFSAIVISLKDFPDLITALKQHRDVANECDRGAINDIADGTISGGAFREAHAAKLRVAVAKINTELDLLPVVPESQGSIPPSVMKN